MTQYFNVKVLLVILSLYHRTEQYTSDIIWYHFCVQLLTLKCLLGNIAIEMNSDPTSPGQVGVEMRQEHHGLEFAHTNLFRWLRTSVTIGKVRISGRSRSELKSKQVDRNLVTIMVHHYPRAQRFGWNGWIQCSAGSTFKCCRDFGCPAMQSSTAAIT